MNNELREEKIELYLNNQLKGDDLRDFEKALKEDKTLVKELAVAKDFKEAIEDAPYEKAFQEKWEAIKQQNKKTTATPSTPKPKNWLLLLTLGLLLVVSSFLIWNFSLKKTTANKEIIYASYYEPYSFNKETRSNSTIKYNEAVSYYNKDAYAHAIPLFEDDLVKFPLDNSTKILLGNCYLFTEPAQPTKAIALFQEILNNNPQLLKETTQWYLTFAFLKNNEIESAKTLLKELAAKDVGKYAKLAQQLLAELQKTNS